VIAYLHTCYMGKRLLRFSVTLVHKWFHVNPHSFGPTWTALFLPCFKDQIGSKYFWIEDQFAHYNVIA